jgi:uncharacterized protein (DUF488 family)
MSQYPIYTIGYGKRDIEEFIDLLRAHGIAYLIDVRSQPYSRYKPDFSKKALAAHLEAAGIRYVFMGDALGGRPGDPACYDAAGKVDYARVEAQGFYQAGIARLQKAHQQQLPVVLMCSEGKPENCHRSKLIGKTLTAVNIPITHIDENDQLITQEDVILRLNDGQPSLFGDEFQTFKSRNRYREENDET